MITRSMNTPGGSFPFLINTFHFNNPNLTTCIIYFLPVYTMLFHIPRTLHRFCFFFLNCLSFFISTGTMQLTLPSEKRPSRPMSSVLLPLYSTSAHLCRSILQDSPHCSCFVSFIHPTTSFLWALSVHSS